MTSSDGVIAMPLDGLDLEALTEAEKQHVAVLLLWAISRARMGHDTTTRFLSEQSDLDDYLAPFRDGPDSPDAGSAWSTVRASSWWASDVPATFPLGRNEIARLNPAGGLALHLLETVRDDKQCQAPVQSLASLLPLGQDRDDLLYDFALEHFVEQASDETPDKPRWPGVLDAELASGSHELADAASVGDWEAVIELLGSPRTAPSLINTWRPGGVSMVTPLHQAAIKGAPIDVVEKLVDLGAWRTLEDSRGWRPVDLALLHGRSEILTLLTPSESRQYQSALNRVLTYRLGKLLTEVTREDAVPRFRPPQVAVIEEVGGEIHFDLSGSGHYFNVFLEEGELLVEHASAGSGESGIVYRVDGTGVIDTWESDDDSDWEPARQPPDDISTEAPTDTAPESSTASSSAGDSGETDQNEVEVPSTSATEAPAEPVPSSPSFRTMWSEMGDCSITVVAHEAVKRFNRERTKSSDAIVVKVSEFKKGRRWESVSVVSAGDEVSDQSVAGKKWAYALVIEYGAGREQLKSNMRLVLEREAESGLGPEAHGALLAAMAQRGGRDLATRVGDFWEQIHALAVSAQVEPQRPNLPNGGADSALHTGVADARERKGASSNHDASTGGDARFDPPMRLKFESANYSAQADWDGESIIVKLGSTARRATLGSMPPEARAIRTDLVRRGVLREVSGRYVFSRDCRFKSVSSAASIISGRTAGGRAEWKDLQGRSINDILGGPKYRWKRS